MKKIYLILAVLLFAGCSTEDSDCCTIIDTKVAIKYVNEAGENLFEIENGLSPADITIYHKINTEWVQFYVEHLDHPKGFMMLEKEDGIYLAVFTSRHNVASNFSETKIEFSESDHDILRAEIDRSNSNEVITKVWYNDELKWEANQTERMFEIVK